MRRVRETGRHRLGGLSVKSPEDFGKIDKQEVLSHSVSEVRVTVTMGELQEKIAKVLESRKTKSA